MTDVAEVVVRATPEGVSDTTDELDEMSGKVEESADSMAEQSEEMSGLAESFQGAMGAVVAGLTVAAGGLLSQVPVIGEAFSGLFAIVNAVAFQMDSVLRPALMPVTQGLFRVANAIFEADGAFGAVIGTLGTVVAVLGTVVGPAALLASKLGLAASTGSALVSTASAIVGAVGTVIGVIASLPLALTAAIAAIAAFSVAYLTNWRGTRNKTNQIVNQIKRIVKRGFINFINAATKFLEGFVSNVVSLFGEIRNEVKTKFNNLIENATQFGKDFVSNFAEGIRDQIGEAIAAASDLANAVGSRISLPSVGGVGTSGGLNAGGGTTTSSAGAALSRQEGRTVIEIEGRQVERATRDFRSDGTDLRGRYG